MTSEQEIAMFGTTEQQLLENIEQQTKHGLYGSKDETLRMMAMSVLSDAQEEINFSYNEQARQTINVAKFYISKIG